MGKGGPLAFLNKKPWHPANLRNLEDVWKREQKKADDDKKLLELQKQHKEERDNEQLQELAQQAGIIKKQERLDWMYQGNLFSQEAVKKEQDKIKQQDEIKEDQHNQEQIAQQQVQQGDQNVPSFYRSSTAQAQNENWHRLHNDPLFMIMKRQQEGIKKITSNPVRMQQIRDQLFNKEKPLEIKAEGDEQKPKIKKEKHKKDKKTKDKDKKKHKQKNKDQQQEIKVKKHDSSSRESTPQLNSQDISDETHFNPKLLDSDQQTFRGEASPREELYNNSKQDPKSNVHIGYRDKHSNHSSLDDDGYKYSKHGKHKRERDGEKRYDKKERQRDSRDQSRQIDVSADAETEKRGHKRHKHKHHDRNEDRKIKGEENRGEGEIQNQKDDTYGLKESEIHRQQDRRMHEKQNQERLRLAALEHQLKQKEEESNRYQKKQYKTGKLSAEDKQRRLQEMTSNAQVHQDLKYSRVKSEPKKEDESGDGYDKYKVAQEIYKLDNGKNNTLEGNLSRKKQQYKSK